MSNLKTSIKRILLSSMALVLLTTGSFVALSFINPPQKASAATVGWYDFGWVGNGNYNARVFACKETVNTAYGPLYQVHAIAFGPKDTAGNFLQFSVRREGRHVAGVQSNNWQPTWTMLGNGASVSGLISPFNGDAFTILVGQPGSSPGTPAVLPYFLQNCS